MRPTTVNIVDVFEDEHGQTHVFARWSGHTHHFLLCRGAIEHRKKKYELSTDQESVLACIEEHFDDWDDHGIDVVATFRPPTPGALRAAGLAKRDRTDLHGTRPVRERRKP